MGKISLTNAVENEYSAGTLECGGEPPVHDECGGGKTMKKILIAVSGLLIGGIALLADAAQSTEGLTVGYIVSELRAASATEMGAVAASIVGRAAGDREQITREVVGNALALRPASILTVVGAIAQTHPDQAGIAAGAVAEKRPELASAVTYAAIERAPDQVRTIVAAVARKAPAKYKEIALAAKKAAPSSDNEILLGIASGVPVLESAVQRARMALASARQVVTVPEAIARVDQMVESAAKSLKAEKSTLLAANDSKLAEALLPPGPPTPGPPFTPAPGVPAVFTTPYAVPVTGPRTYSAP